MSELPEGHMASVNGNALTYEVHGEGTPRPCCRSFRFR